MGREFKNTKSNTKISPTYKFRTMKEEQNISRKEAIKKIGKYSALTAAGTFMLLNPKQAQAASISQSGTQVWGDPFD